jgi:hypothetical protein
MTMTIIGTHILVEEDEESLSALCSSIGAAETECDTPRRTKKYKGEININVLYRPVRES